jgi:hypothetical protein
MLGARLPIAVPALNGRNTAYPSLCIKRASASPVITDLSAQGASAPRTSAIAQVNAWIDAGARWVRFNPDAHYLESAMAKSPARAVQNPAGKRLARNGIAGQLEPEEANGGPSDAQGMTATVSELADRTHRNNWTSALTAVLVQ